MKSNRKSNRIIWGLISLVVLTTLAISFGTMSSHSQKDASKEQDKSPFGDLSKYPIADYNAPEPQNAAERDKRIIKNKRYDKKLLVSPNPRPDAIASIFTDAEPVPSCYSFCREQAYYHWRGTKLESTTIQ